ncbi:MAG: phosphoglycerate dehydrogenase [Pseudomonadota bacterium]
MPKVLISDKLSETAVNIFKNRGIETIFSPDLGKDPAALLEAVKDVDGLAIRSATKVTSDVLAAAENLKVVGRAGIGVDNVDIPTATARGVVVMNTPFGNAITTAEHAIALMFALARQIPQANESTHAGRWEKSKFMGTELFGKTLGVIGCGNIGANVAERALGLKMRVVAYDPFLSEPRAVELGVEKVDLETLLAGADVITLHTPLTDQTKNILSKDALSKTKKGVLIINCARGGLIDEDALFDALKAGHLGGAALDVYEEEPAKSHKLFGTQNVVATPHLGASTREAQENVAIQVAEQMSEYLLKGAVTNALNMASISAEEAPRLRPFIKLAEYLGAFVGQLTETSVQAIEVTYAGAVAKLNPRPMTASAIAGVLRPMLGDVNIVNAPVIAKERGVAIAETFQDSAKNFESVIRLRIVSERSERIVAGALFGSIPRIVEIDGVEMEAAISPRMLFVNNDDKPGFIGALGGTLGDKGVNIATFNLGRSSRGADAIALLAVDDVIDDAVIADVRSLPHVKRAKSLSF